MNLSRLIQQHEKYIGPVPDYRLEMWHDVIDKEGDEGIIEVGRDFFKRQKKIFERYLAWFYHYDNWPFDAFNFPEDFNKLEGMRDTRQQYFKMIPNLETEEEKIEWILKWENEGFKRDLVLELQVRLDAIESDRRSKLTEEEQEYEDIAWKFFHGVDFVDMARKIGKYFEVQELTLIIPRNKQEAAGELRVLEGILGVLPRQSIPIGNKRKRRLFT